jgi:protein tyrosine phosphatase (PTP) superfamily phosphohydrolase (DUF442 family)
MSIDEVRRVEREGDEEREQKPARRWLTFVVFALALAAAVALWLWRLDTYHFAEVEKGVLYRDGNRGMREFSTALRKGNIKTVVMLNDDEEVKQEPFKSELEQCREKGVEVIRIPVKLGGYPSDAEVREFLNVMNDRSKWPVMVHCAQGVRRTAMMVAAYQESVLGYDDERAKGAILPWGRKATSQTLGDIRSFIEAYDGKNRVVTTRPVQVGEE